MYTPTLEMGHVCPLAHLGTHSGMAFFFVWKVGHQA